MAMNNWAVPKSRFYEPGFHTNAKLEAPILYFDTLLFDEPAEQGW